jgi:hypothetical protein
MVTLTIEGQPAHRGRGVELLGHRDEPVYEPNFLSDRARSHIHPFSDAVEWMYLEERAEGSHGRHDFRQLPSR